MGRKFSALLAAAASIPAASAQIVSDYGYYNNEGIIGLLEHLLGLSINNPYELTGLAATVGIMWVSIYAILKIGIKKLDEGIDDSSLSGSGYFAESLGVGDTDQKNILALLSLLIVLTTLGTGYFTGLVRTWQSIFVLLFVIMALALLVFVVVGGAYGTIGGVSVARGAGKQLQAAGMEQLADAQKTINEAEQDIADLESASEEDIEQGDTGEADREARIAAEDIQEVIQELESVEDRIDELENEELQELEDFEENLDKVVDLIGDDSS